MQKAERRAFGGRQFAQVRTRCLEQIESANDIGLDEIARAVDRAVDMAFGGEMHDGARLVLAQQRVNQWSVVDIAVHEYVIRVGVDRRQVVRIAGISQAVEVDDRGLFPGKPVQDKVGADKACSAGDEYQDDFSSVREDCMR